MTPAAQPDPDQTRKPSLHETEHQEAREALREIPQLLTELQEYALHFVAAERALLFSAIRSGVLKAATGVVALLAGAAAIITAVSLLLIGIAQVIGRLAGGRAWLGNLLVGGGLLLLVGIGLWLTIRSVRRSSIGRTIQQFESRKDLQRDRFHRSVWERSGAVPLRKSPDGKAQA